MYSPLIFRMQTKYKSFQLSTFQQEVQKYSMQPSVYSPGFCSVLVSPQAGSFEAVLAAFTASRRTSCGIFVVDLCVALTTGCFCVLA